MRKVAIVSPAYDGKVVCNYAITMAEIFRLAAKDYPNLELHLNFWMYEALLQKARNNLFADAIRQDVDDLVFIDCDQSFDPKAFFTMLNHPVDVVGAPVRMKTDQERYNIRPEHPLLHDYDFSLDLLEVENIGTGFLRLSKKAMQALWQASQPYNDGGAERRMICDLQIINGGIISEDIQICTKLRDAGFKIYVDPYFTCKHFGVKCYDGDYFTHYHSYFAEDDPE